MRLALLSLALVCCVVPTVAFAQDIYASSDTAAISADIPAYLSWYGNSGLVRTPSAGIAAPLQLGISAHRVQYSQDTQDVFNVSVALIPDLEVGGTYITNTFTPDSISDTLGNAFLLNAKYRLNFREWFNMGPNAPDVAVGVWDATDQLDRSLYVVASKTFQVVPGDCGALKISAGFGRAQRDASNRDVMFAGRALDGVFGGIEFRPLSSALVQAEYDGHDINVDLRFAPARDVTLDLGAVDGRFAWGAAYGTSF